MFTLLVGTDKAARSKRLATLTAQLSKSGADIKRYTDITFDPESLLALAGANSLFGGTIVVVITGVADNAESRAELEKLFPVFAESAHQFILSESALLAATMKKAAQSGATIEEFDEKAEAKKAEAFNAFLLTDAFSDRRRSMAWALYRKAIDLGVEPRELHGKIFWAVKTMLVASTAKSGSDSGQNPFVYQKAKRASQNFAPGELEALVKELAVLFHEALVSGIDLETSLEAFLLRSLARVL